MRSDRDGASARQHFTTTADRLHHTPARAIGAGLAAPVRVSLLTRPLVQLTRRQTGNRSLAASEQDR